MADMMAEPACHAGPAGDHAVPGQSEKEQGQPKHVSRQGSGVRR